VIYKPESIENKGIIHVGQRKDQIFIKEIFQKVT